MSSNLFRDVIPTGSADVCLIHTGTNQSVALDTVTKVNFDTVDIDTASMWDASSEVIKPVKAGYYRVTAFIDIPGGVDKLLVGILFKNADQITQTRNHASTASDHFTVVTSKIVYLNGSTDYVYASIYQGVSNPVTLYTDGARSFLMAEYLGE